MKSEDRNLGWLTLEPYAQIVRERLAQYESDASVLAFAIKGSLARGDAVPGCDLDLHVVLAERKPFVAAWIEGARLERKGHLP